MLMKTVFAKFRSKRSSKSNSRASSTISDPLGHAAQATTSVTLATIGVAPPDNDRRNIAGAKASPPVESKTGWKTTAYNGTKLVLDVVKESSDALAPPLKNVVGGLTALLKHYDQYIANKDDVQRLIHRVELLISSLTGPPQENDIREIKRRGVLESNLKKVVETLDPMLNQSTFSGFLNNVDQAAKITGVIEDIRDAIIDYQTSLQQGLNENTMKLIETAHLVLFDKLPCAKSAGYESGDRQKCLRGTRVRVLEAIENWVQYNRRRRVYWLNGVAGTGKTTIAQSFAERMFAEGLLGASFFCSRDFLDRRDLHFIFPTLAFQLAYKYPDFRAQLVQILTMSPNVGHESLSNQLNKLLVEPLQLTGVSTVIIIDALDECEDEQPASAILSLLARAIDQIPLVKFFITGRPEPRIRKGFRLPTLHPQTEVLLLHEVEPTDVDEDIKLFLEYHLKELVKDRSDINVTTPWPTPEDIRVVTSKAAGLFIYASTIVKFLDSDTHTPQERLWLVTSMPHSSVYEGQSGIDTLYTCVFVKGCAHVRGSDFSFFSKLLLVTSSVVLLWEPISVASLARLLGVSSQDILTPIRSLHSVLLVPESDSKPIRVFHKSFPDYITDNGRCKDSRFFVDSPVHHARLAVRCFELMKVGLKKNVCDLPQYAMNDDVRDLSIRQQKSIGEAMAYACRFWAKHLCLISHTGDNVEQILELLKKFVQRQLLQWLEVLSIVKDMRCAVHTLVDVEQWLLKVNVSDEDLLSSIRECRRFVLYSFDGIEQSAAHIYDSALLWPPVSSLVRTQYQNQLKTQVKVLNGVDNSWDACIRAVQLGDATVVSSVTFSHRGNLIAGCIGTVVKILEAATGVCLATLNELENDVNSVTFSPDDAFLAAGSDDHTVPVWDMQTGVLVRRFTGHKGSVNSVAFSPTGSIVASGSNDTTIRIWNLPSGDCDRILEGHSSHVQSICWLQTNEVVSGCGSGEVKVWKVESGECVKTFDQYFDHVWCVASSPDASKIASGSADSKIRVYNTHTGDIIHTVMADGVVSSVYFSLDGETIVYTTSSSIVIWDLGKEVSTIVWQPGSRSVVWSPDGSCIAAGSWEGLVKIFQIQTGNRGGSVCDQHSNEVLCISSSTDGRKIASGSQDTTVKVWDAATGSCVQTFNGHSSWIRSVAFSPDSSLVASTSYDRTVRIWGLHDVGLVTSLEEHNGPVFGVGFSPDGRRMVSVSEQQEIILWDAGKWEMLAYLPALDSEGSDLRVSFSGDGNRIILESLGVVGRWNILPNPGSPSEHAAGHPSSHALTKEISLPMILVPISDVDATPDEDVQPRRYSIERGWIIDEQFGRLCWVPADKRACSDFNGKKVILGTTSGRVVIVDLGEVSVRSQGRRVFA